ncbi:hypothetical protein F5Y00DRAFT_78765 [Daldinia vernicosa]|uniref:uncharacterized protein n=1 Tax=Daldinia vernicosa TaxID=114800 RepID=UPI00200775D2|nr:uncharacterized protein F5Y00DRAFT_78765 [Daldinia vernicosa]KAI0848953.1 hypothetical protein F5Y00DRAFT_78765 [Daldinia vernicosa]
MVVIHFACLLGLAGLTGYYVVVASCSSLYVALYTHTDTLDSGIWHLIIPDLLRVLLFHAGVDHFPHTNLQPIQDLNGIGHQYPIRGYSEIVRLI